MNAFGLCRWYIVFTQRNFVGDLLQVKCHYRRTTVGRFAFSNPLWGLGATSDVHLRLIGKRVVDFLLVLRTFFSLGVTAEALRVNIGVFARKRSLQFCPKFQVEEVVTHQPFFFSENENKHYFIWYKSWAEKKNVLLFCHNSRVWQTHGQTDGQTDRYFALRPSGVTRVADTRGGNSGCHPSIYPLKNLATFF